MANRRTEIRSSNRFSFLGLQITVDSDCSYEIKRHLFLGRKAMTNLDSILKNRDIILPTNIHVIKAMVFPSVMNGCESWLIKKAESQRIDASNCGVAESLGGEGNGTPLQYSFLENPMDGGA